MLPRILYTSLAVLGLLAAAATPAAAMTISFGLEGQTSTVLNESGTLTPPEIPGGIGVWVLDAPTTVDGILINSWTSLMKTDPFVTNNINVTNTSATTQTFVATVILPIPAYSYDQIIASSVGVTVTDSSGDNILSFANSGSTPFYQGQVNGVTLLPLNTPNMPLTTADCTGGAAPGCTAVDSNNPPNQAAGPGVANDIAIVLTFQLSAFDSAGITSRFEIIPEPTTGLLLGLGLTGLAFAGRRRS